MNAFKKYLPFALFVAFLVFGLDAFFSSKPPAKNERVYKIVQQYSPYYIDKRFGGLEILSKEDKEFKEKPNNMSFFKEFSHLEKRWAQKHMKREGQTVTIVDQNGTTVATISLQNKEESDFVKNYYGL